MVWMKKSKRQGHHKVAIVNMVGETKGVKGKGTKCFKGGVSVFQTMITQVNKTIPGARDKFIQMHTTVRML